MDDRDPHGGAATRVATRAPSQRGQAPAPRPLGPGAGVASVLGATAGARCAGDGRSPMLHSGAPHSRCSAHLVPRIAINATPVLSPLTGIGTYVSELGAALAHAGADLYSFYGTPGARPAAAPAVADPAQRVLTLRSRARHLVPFRRQLRHAQQRIVFGAGVRRHAIELYHEPNYVPLASELPLVVTIHDLSWLRHPETHPADRVRWLERGVPPALDRAQAILVDSRFIGNELIATFGVEPARVHTALLGVGKKFRRREPAETRATLGAHALVHGSYVLSLATFEPRKNIAHVLDAYALLPASCRRRFPLVLAGATGWKAAPLVARIRALQARGEVRWLGFVPSAALPDLYAGAAAFVFPSFYEGFGLPPLEAMACGVPALVAGRAALPEVVGDAALVIDPDDPQGTAEALAALLDDLPRRQALGLQAEARAASFTWAACAEATLAAYAAALA